jgi:tyrosyl-tRNA synthetase
MSIVKEIISISGTFYDNLPGEHEVTYITDQDEKKIEKMDSNKVAKLLIIFDYPIVKCFSGSYIDIFKRSCTDPIRYDDKKLMDVYYKLLELEKISKIPKQEDQLKIYELITRNMKEIIGINDLKELIKKKYPTVYWGTACTNSIHMAYLLPMLKIADLLDADCTVIVLLADLHAMLDSLKSTEKELKARTKYYELMITTLLKRLNVNTNNLIFKIGTSFQLSKEYTMDVYRTNSFITVNQAIHAGSDVVKSSEKNPFINSILYPTLQVLDMKYLEADIFFGGIDQRKINTFSRDILPKLGYKKGIFIMNEMIPGLSKTSKKIKEDDKNKENNDEDKNKESNGENKNKENNDEDKNKESNVSNKNNKVKENEINQESNNRNKNNKVKENEINQESDDENKNNKVKENEINQDISQKMSSSDPTSKIDLLDSIKVINKKINSTFCEPKNIEDNTLLVLIEKLIFPVLNRLKVDFIINRQEKYGGKIEYKEYKQIYDDFSSNILTPQDLKQGLIENINFIIEPIRQTFLTDNNKKILFEAYGMTFIDLIKDQK